MIGDVSAVSTHVVQLRYAVLTVGPSGLSHSLLTEINSHAEPGGITGQEEIMQYGEAKKVLLSFGLSEYQATSAAAWLTDGRETTMEEVQARAEVYLNKKTKEKINRQPGIAALLDLCDKE